MKMHARNNLVQRSCICIRVDILIYSKDCLNRFQHHVFCIKIEHQHYQNYYALCGNYSASRFTMQAQHAFTPTDTQMIQMGPKNS